MTHYYFLRKVLFFLLVLFLIGSLKAQVKTSDWELNSVNARKQVTLEGVPKTALRATISVRKFKQVLKPIQQEIQLPNPEGQFETFIIEPTNVVAPEVAHLYTIKTFKGYKKGDPSTLIACDISDNGFHAGVYTAENSYFIEPQITQPSQINHHHAIYYKRESEGGGVHCKVKHAVRRVAPAPSSSQRHQAVAKRTFRLAVVATGEYGKQFGGIPYKATNVLNSLASGVNLINPIYLRDVGVTFTLVTTAAMVFGDPATDNINTSNANDIFAKIKSISDAAITNNGYDLGHAVVWANLGGLASAGVVCDAAQKHEGYSTSDKSFNTIWVDYVAHEIGHQFNADHNFASTECETSTENFRYEPGEVSSIMGYADVCVEAARYASDSDPFFHYASIEVMNTYIATINCGTTESTGNTNDPVSDAKSDITVPKQTPFILVGSGTDANDPAGNLSYNWSQYDGDGPAFAGKPDCNATQGPLFRFRPPASTAMRNFPQYADVLAGNNNSVDWEKLPCKARTLNFSLAVRDNNTAFGRVDNDLMKVTVSNTGPFNVTAPNGGETLTGDETSTITWTVNGTDAHCANVDILLSTDGGATYTVIADATTNDGTEEVTIPNTASTSARIIVRCDVMGGFRSASTFYDVSNANFTIEEGTASACDMDLATTDFDNHTVSDDYEAENTITSDKPLAAASIVNFYAGTAVTLKPGFEVPSGAQFLAKIQDCTTSSALSMEESELSTPNEQLLRPTQIVPSDAVVFTDLKYKIFPNPARNHLTIVNGNDSSLNYRVLSLNGVVLNQGVVNVSTELDVQRLNHGMYFLELVDRTQGIKKVEKVIVSKYY